MSKVDRSLGLGLLVLFTIGLMSLLVVSYIKIKEADVRVETYRRIAESKEGTLLNVQGGGEYEAVIVGRSTNGKYYNLNDGIDSLKLGRWYYVAKGGERRPLVKK